MAKITHRLPWRMQFGYTEIEYQTGEPVDFPALALDAATMEDSFAATFPEPDRVPERQYEDAPFEEGEPPHPSRQQPPRGSQRPQQGRGGDSNQYGVTLECPDHRGAILRPSVRNKNMDYIEDLGKEIPASWFHTGPDGRTCSVYQSRAVWVR